MRSLLITCLGLFAPALALAALQTEQHRIDVEVIRDRRKNLRTPPPDGATVLVVDDSITTRTIEKNVLERSGYEVTTAVSAEEAASYDAFWKPEIAGKVDAGVCDVANINAPGQIVLSGEIAAMEQAIELAGPRKAMKLPVKVSAPIPVTATIDQNQFRLSRFLRSWMVSSRSVPSTMFSLRSGPPYSVRAR